MSKTLARKALALAEEGLELSSKKKSVQSSNSKDSDLTTLHKKPIKHGDKWKSKPKRVERLTVVEARKQLRNVKDSTDENIKKLLLLSSANIGHQATGKLVKRAQTGRYVVKAKELVPKKNKKESVFSEEDFAKFEEELKKLG
ncbi:uncharacterized protein LOC128743821 [Sabethes cyaneus]|uniref:uncharacterized protein LOC128743821 n=1 Tax=Sabethes cyaneus TaxID=53552 RepID=UPI00221E2DA7|nr:uncharacterized protein LOC128743821 [Sabethes cyaneus]